MTNWECAVEIARAIDKLSQKIVDLNVTLEKIESHLDFLCGEEKTK